MQGLSAPGGPSDDLRTAPRRSPAWLSSLARLAAARAGRPGPEVETHMRALLAAAPSDGLAPGGRSSLNNDGTPLQVCLTAGPAVARVRLLADPGFQIADAAGRFAAATRTMRAQLDAAGAADLRDACDQMLRLMLPSDARDLAALPAGAMWLGAGIGTPDLAVYTAGRWGALADRWPRAARWLAAALPASGRATRLIATLGPIAALASGGLEGTGRGDGRAKLYFRLRQPVSLSALGVDLFRHPSMAELLALVVGARPIARDGLVLSLGFSLADGELVDAKIDVCAHCLGHAPGAWIEILDRIAGLGIARLGLERDLAQGGVEVAFIGHAVDARGERRLGLYLKGRAQ